MDKYLHIVTHDVPWPADYGGVVDLFYKIKSLHQEGVKIHLHCFTNGRAEQTILNRYCESVTYYPRKNKLTALPAAIPYIVQSRSDENLLKNLKKDDHPILLEGIHCTYFLHKGYLHDRRVFVRLHNVEHQYYKQLALHEDNIFKKLYFNIESEMLKRYEKNLADKSAFWTVSTQDAELYRNKFHAKDLEFLPVFVPWNNPKSISGNGNFCLYHGNLSINENEKAVEWLLNNVFNSVKIPFVIAGKNPSANMHKLAHRHKHTCLVANPSEHELGDLIKKAQVNILPSFNNTGVKLKLLNAVFNGRHCLVNAEAAIGTGIESLCMIASGAEMFKEEVKRLYSEPFTDYNIQARSQMLNNLYNNEKNARQLISWIY